MQSEKKHKSTVAIIGGGRWGQVTLSVLAKMNLPHHYVVVSKANYHAVQQQLASIESSLSSFSVVHTAAELSDQHEVHAAIVVNAARDHFQTASSMINKGVHVLIEKPVVLSSVDMNSLINDARKKDLIIIPGLCYRFCSYIHQFALEMKNKGIPAKFTCEWHDVKNEYRYGQKKNHDTSINVVQDVMPHVWTILSAIFSVDLHVVSCQLTANGDGAEIIVSIGDVRGTIMLNRNASKRKRYLSVEYTSGKQIILDFTTEPGFITHGSVTRSGDENWNQQPGPLMQQLYHFFSAINNNIIYKQDIEACLQSVKFVDDVMACLESSPAREAQFAD